MLPIQRIKIKDNLTKSLGDIFSPCDIFVIVIPSLLSPLAWTWVSVTQCWRKLALDGRQIASTDTGNIYSASAPHSQLFPKFKAGLWAPRRGLVCQLVRIRADIKLLSSGQFIKIPVHFVHNGRRKHFDPEMFLILSAIFQNYLTPYSQFFHVCGLRNVWYQG